MMYSSKVALVALLTSTVCVAHATATTLPYRGYLTDDAGAPINGRIDVSAELYACDGVETSCPSVWGPLTIEGVEVIDGLLAFSLEDILAQETEASTLEEVLAAHVDLWLDVALRTDGEPSWTPLTPRHQLHAVPYSVIASDAQKLAGLDAASYAQLSDLSSYATTAELQAYAQLEELNGSGFLTAEDLATYGYATSESVNALFLNYTTTEELEALYAHLPTPAEQAVAQEDAAQIVVSLQQLIATNTSAIDTLIANAYTNQAAVAAGSAAGFITTDALPSISRFDEGYEALDSADLSASTTKSVESQVPAEGAGNMSFHLALNVARTHLEFDVVYRVTASVGYKDYTAFPIPEQRPDSVAVSGSAAIDVYAASLEDGQPVCSSSPSDDAKRFSSLLDQVVDPLEHHGVVHEGVNPENVTEGWGVRVRGAERAVVPLQAVDQSTGVCVKVVPLAYCFGAALGANCSVETQIEDVIIRRY